MIAVSCVWSLFVVVTVVYSEVILEAVDENACPGRIEDDNSKQVKGEKAGGSEGG